MDPSVARSPARPAGCLAAALLVLLAGPATPTAGRAVAFPAREPEPPRWTEPVQETEPVRQVEPSPRALTLDAIFLEGGWDAEGAPAATWLDGASYATLEPSDAMEGAFDLVRWRLDGTREPLVTATELSLGIGREPRRVESFRLSPDRRSVLLFANPRRAGRTHLRGDYWVFDLAARVLTRLGASGRSGVTEHAEFSPDSSRVAFVRDHDLYVQDLRTGTETRLTLDGDDQILNGTFDWVYEQLSTRHGYRWSPDGSQIAYWQIDTTLVPERVRVDHAAGLDPEPRRLAYPRVGQINPAARVGVVPSGGGETRWVRFPDSPRDHYLARIHWVPAGDLLVLERLDRRQRHNRVYRVDVRRPELDPRLVLDEQDAAWVDVHTALSWLDGGRSFTWLSERDGWRRLYRADLGGGGLRPLTPPELDVMGVAFVDPAGGDIYYTAADDSPTRRALYRTRGALDGPPQLERVTPLGDGFNEYRISPDGRAAFHTRSSFASPPRVDLVRLPTHEPIRTLVDNASLRVDVAALEIDHELLRLAAGETQLDAWLMSPAAIDPARRHPLLVYTYGEPWAQTVLDRWDGRRLLWHRLLNGAGFAVASIDNRGTPAPRGRDWRKRSHGDPGTLAAADQAEAVEALAGQAPWIDRERVGIWGWAGGGSVALHALFRHADTFALGMAIAPVADPRTYDSFYQERAMGTPDDNPAGYRRGSPMTWVDGLRGPLLLVDGTPDSDVHAAGTAALIDALVGAGKPFSMMAYPSGSASSFDAPGTTRHLYGLLTSFLRDHLADDAR